MNLNFKNTRIHLFRKQSAYFYTVIIFLYGIGSITPGIHSCDSISYNKYCLWINSNVTLLIKPLRILTDLTESIMMEITDGYMLKINMKNIENLFVFQFESISSAAVAWSNWKFVIHPFSVRILSFVEK